MGTEAPPAGDDTYKDKISHQASIKQFPIWRVGSLMNQTRQHNPRLGIVTKEIITYTATSKTRKYLLPLFKIQVGNLTKK